MNAPTEFQLDVLSISLIVLFYVLYGFRRQWNSPLRNGPGYFLGVQVPPGFYSGPGIRWLKHYHFMVILLFSVMGLTLAAMVVAGRLDATPLWCGGTAIVFVATMQGFVAWTRHKIGANPPVLATVAAPLEARRLCDYVSWKLEAFVTGIVGLSWLTLFLRGHHVDWSNPVTTTWAILGLLPGKIVLVRSSFPLPPERTEEHHRLSEARRRYSLRYMDAFRWCLLANLAAYAVIRSWAAAQGGWLNWAFVLAQLVPWAFFVALMIRGEQRLAHMGRDLRPAGSWSTPFRPARLMLPGGLTWFTIWFGGLIGLLVFYQG